MLPELGLLSHDDLLELMVLLERLGVFETPLRLWKSHVLSADTIAAWWVPQVTILPPGFFRPLLIRLS